MGGFAKWQAVIIARVRAAAFGRVQQGAVFEEEGRVVAAQGGAQQAHRVFCVAGEGNPPAQRVGENGLGAEAMPGVARFLAEANRDAHDHRRGEVVGGAPAHKAQIIDLLVGGVGVLAELDLWHGQQAGKGHADRAAKDAIFGQGGVKNALGAEMRLHALRGAVHATFNAHILPEDQQARVVRHLNLQRAPHRINQVDARAAGLGEVGAKGEVGARGAQASLEWGHAFEEAVPGGCGGVRLRNCLGSAARLIQLPGNFLLQGLPLGET